MCSFAVNHRGKTMYSMNRKEQSEFSKFLERPVFKDIPKERQNKFINLNINTDQDVTAMLALQFEYLHHYVKKSSKPQMVFVEGLQDIKTDYQTQWIELSKTVTAEALLDHIQKTVDAYILILENQITDKNTLAAFNYETGLFDQKNDYLQNFHIGQDNESNDVNNEITALIEFLVEESSAKAFYTEQFQKSDDVNFRKTLLKTLTLEIALMMVDADKVDLNLLSTMVNLLPEEYKSEPLHYIQTEGTRAYSCIILLVSQLKMHLTAAPSSKKVVVEETKQTELQDSDVKAEEVKSTPKKEAPKSKFIAILKENNIDVDSLSTADKRKRFQDMIEYNKSNQNAPKEEKVIESGIDKGTFAQRRANLANLNLFRQNNNNNSVEVKPLTQAQIQPVQQVLNNNSSNSADLSSSQIESFKEKQNRLAQALSGNKTNNNSENPPQDFPVLITKVTVLQELTDLNKAYLEKKQELNGYSPILLEGWKTCAKQLRTEALTKFGEQLKNMVATPDEKISFCDDVMKLNIFCDQHENRSAFFGFGQVETNAVKEIKKCKAEFEFTAKNAVYSTHTELPPANTNNQNG